MCIRDSPQGSCCGPGFWNIQYNSLLNLDFTKRTKLIAFADDLIVLTSGKSLLKAENYGNLEMAKISNWATNNKVSFNEQKSKILLISRKRLQNSELSIYLNSKKLQQVNKLKYLGFIIDTKFNFNEHIQYVVERCTKLIHMLSRSAKLNWGLGHEALKTIYKGAILPLLSYGAPVWIDALERKSNQMKFRRVQRLVNIKIAKAFVQCRVKVCAF